MNTYKHTELTEVGIMTQTTNPLDISIRRKKKNERERKRESVILVR